MLSYAYFRFGNLLENSVDYYRDRDQHVRMHGPFCCPTVVAVAVVAVNSLCIKM